MRSRSLRVRAVSRDLPLRLELPGVVRVAGLHGATGRALRPSGRGALASRKAVAAPRLGSRGDQRQNARSAPARAPSWPARSTPAASTRHAALTVSAPPASTRTSGRCVRSRVDGGRAVAIAHSLVGIVRHRARAPRGDRVDVSARARREAEAWSLFAHRKAAMPEPTDAVADLQRRREGLHGAGGGAAAGLPRHNESSTARRPAAGSRRSRHAAAAARS